MTYQVSRLLLAPALLLFSSSLLYGQFTSLQNGAWDDCATWVGPGPMGDRCDGVGDDTDAGDGFPDRDDAVIIASSHTVTINNIQDNTFGVTGTFPDLSGDDLATNLGLTNVSDVAGGLTTPVPGMGTNAFLHDANITIQANATLQFTAVLPFLIGPNATVTLSATTSTLDVNAGNNDMLIFGTLDALGPVDVGDELILTGNSVVFFDDGGNLAGDDVYIDHEDAILCGSGTLTLANEIRHYNDTDGTVLDQICVQTTVTCTGGNCCVDECPDGDATLDGGVSPGGTSGTNPLPIELIYFRASYDQEEVALTWSTASETNNDFFSIERSADAENWEVIEHIPGQGTTLEQQNYHTVDVRPLSGLSYYRLKQTDFDGTFSHSSVVVVSREADNIEVWPTLLTSSRMHLSIATEENIIALSITDFNGKIYPITIAPENVASSISFSLQALNLTSGVYFLNVFQEHRSFTQKLLVQ